MTKNRKEPSPLRGQARRDAVLAATMALMAEKGAGRVSIADVAARASASKETVYRHFGDRNGLLVAVLDRFASLQLAACPAPPDNEVFGDGLERLGTWYLTMATRPEVLSFYRYVVGAAEENPSLGEAFTTHVTQPVLKTIREYLEGFGVEGDGDQLSQAYLGLLQGKFWNRALVEPDFEISEADVTRQVESARRLFAAGVGR